MREKALNLLGLMRKANALRIGEEDTGSAVREHEAKLVLLASTHRRTPKSARPDICLAAKRRS